MPPPSAGLAAAVLERVAALPTPVPAEPAGWLRRVTDRVTDLGSQWQRRAAVAVVALLVALLATPPVRAAVADWFGFAGVIVQRGPVDAEDAPPPPAVDDAMTVAEAAELVDFVPLVPAELGEPDGVDVSDDRVIVSMSWSTPEGPVRLDQFDGRLDFGIAKTSPGVQYANVAGNDALWFEEPHEVVILDDAGPAADRDGTARRSHADLAGRRRHLAARGRPEPRAGGRDRLLRGAVRRVRRRSGTHASSAVYHQHRPEEASMRVSLVRALLTAALAVRDLARRGARQRGRSDQRPAVHSGGGEHGVALLHRPGVRRARRTGRGRRADRDVPGQGVAGGHAYGAGVTVTWLVHDVEPWRVDRIYLGAQDGPWISTQVSDGSGSIWESPVLWHQPEQGKRLAGLLEGLGLGTEAAKDTSFDGVAGAPVPESDDTVAAPPAATGPEPATAAESTWRNAGWAAGGLLGGLLGGVLLTLAWTRRRSTDEDEPEPALAGPDGYAEVLAR